MLKGFGQNREGRTGMQTVSVSSNAWGRVEKPTKDSAQVAG